MDRTGRLDGILYRLHVSAGFFPILADLADGAKGPAELGASHGCGAIPQLVCDLYGRRLFW